ncbi:MAG: hypothetical protein H0U44_05805 [Flavisolibacter sp.]|jgi:hypothetical protein|nr:hypothetical protein [Flavisolibacter sp.]
MEFVIVLSYQGSLAFFEVTQVTETHYQARLKTHGEKRVDLPAKLDILKKEGAWAALPGHEEILNAVVNAIEYKAA